jgi:hypothetical protein
MIDKVLLALKAKSIYTLFVNQPRVPAGGPGGGQWTSGGGGGGGGGGKINPADHTFEKKQLTFTHPNGITVAAYGHIPKSGVLKVDKDPAVEAAAMKRGPGSFKVIERDSNQGRPYTIKHDPSTGHYAVIIRDKATGNKNVAVFKHVPEHPDSAKIRATTYLEKAMEPGLYKDLHIG